MAVYNLTNGTMEPGLGKFYYGSIQTY